MRRLILTAIIPNDEDWRREWHHLTQASGEIAALGRDVNVLSETLQVSRPEPMAVVTEESLYKTRLALSDVGVDEAASERVLKALEMHGVIVVERP